MILYSGYIGSEKGNLLQSKFDTEDEELIRMLEDYHRHNNYHQLKSNIETYLERFFGRPQPQPTIFRSLK
jgi:transcriptional regulator with AAA-type ATPase domain